MPPAGATGRLWSLPGVSDNLMRLVATLENGDSAQVAACIPAAVELEDVYKRSGPLTDAQVDAVLTDKPPRYSNCLDPATLPNLVDKIVRTCFSSQRPGNRSVDPIGHVLNKAWPMRCSVRNFSEIVSNYITGELPIYHFVCSVLHASMLGIYPSCTTRAALGIQLMLYRHYIHHPISAEHLSKWVLQDNHVILFVAIKEYIAFAISMVPGLEQVLKESYNWSAFSDSVTKQADMIRRTLNSNLGSPSSMFTAALQAVAGVKSFKCPTPPLDISVTCDSMLALVRMSHHPDSDVYDKPLRMNMYHIMAPLVRGGAPIYEVALAMGVVPEIARAMCASARSCAYTSVSRKGTNVACDNTIDALLAHEFVQAWSMCHKIRAYRLPAHIEKEQRQSSATTSERIVYACVCCRQLREFVVDDTSNTGNGWACGHQKVILDDVTGDVFCGKRIEKAVAPTRSNATESGRSYWKAQQSVMCGFSPLLKIPMLGTILAFYGKLYVMCPGCTCIMRLHGPRYLGGSIRCVNCSYKTHTQCGSARCFHCYNGANDLTEVALCHNVVNVCKACVRRWMQIDRYTRVIDEDTAHQAINERWSTNRVAVHCACI